MYEAVEIAPSMWAVGKDGDFLTARLYDTADEARAAVRALNAMEG